MREYPLKIGDNIYNMYHIGVNHTAYGSYIGGVISAYNELLDNNDEVNIESGIGDMRHCVIGDIREAYEILKEILKTRNPESFMEYMECVQETIQKYFGDYSNVEKRLSFFPDDDDVYNGVKEIGKVSDLAHQNAAMCVERSMVSQNLLKTLGFDATIKQSGIINNGKKEAHAYNLVAHDGKYYIFDSTIPTLREGVISPIICEIPKEDYDKISSPTQEIGESVHVIHFNPLQNKEYDITYDAGRKDVYEIESSFTK